MLLGDGGGDKVFGLAARNDDGNPFWGDILRPLFALRNAWMSLTRCSCSGEEGERD